MPSMVDGRHHGMLGASKIARILPEIGRGGLADRSAPKAPDLDFKSATFRCIVYLLVRGSREIDDVIVVPRPRPV
jgi:hypothetical protein